MTIPDVRSPRLSRREMLGLLGIGAGVAFPAADLLGAVAKAPAATAAKVTFPEGAVIRTLLKDVPPGALPNGATLFHEHFSIDLPPITPRPANAPPLPPNPTKHLHLMIKEAKAASADGVACIVDGGHGDMGRDLEFLKKLTSSSGLAIVASGGYYMQRTYPADLANRSEDQIAEELAREATANRYGAFGEIGENPNAPMSDLEQKVFRAVGKAHVRTHLPVFTHNAYGTGAMVPDDKKVTMVLAFLDAGYVDHLLICSDFTGRRSDARPGYANSVTVFIPKLRAAGVKDDVLHQIMHDNPRRFLAFVPGNFLPNTG